MNVPALLSNFYIEMRERGVNLVGLVLTQKGLSLVHILNQLEKMPPENVRWNPDLKHYQLEIRNHRTDAIEGVIHLVSTGDLNNISTDPGGETGERGGEEEEK